jgi:hypothetical protein
MTAFADSLAGCVFQCLFQRCKISRYQEPVAKVIWRDSRIEEKIYAVPG